MIENKETIEKWLDKVFRLYKDRLGDVTLPIDEEILVRVFEELKGIKIELEKERKIVSAGIDEGILIPKKGGFILKYGLNPYKGEERIFSPVARKRFTICHELGHILFYDCSYVIPKLRESPQEHICHDIARKLLLPEEAVKRKFTEKYKDGTDLITFLREFSESAKVSIYPVAKRLTEELCLLKDIMVTFWKYIGDKSQPEICYEKFRRDSKLCSELAKFLPYYWRRQVYMKAWNEGVSIVLSNTNNITSFRKQSLLIEGRKRRKGKLKQILFDIECETWVDLSNSQHSSTCMNRVPLDVLSVEKFDLNILEKGR